MKLKLIPQGEIQILEITETLLPEEVAILRAGLNKLFQDSPKSGKKWFVLDLTRTQIEQQTTRDDVRTLTRLAQQYGGMIWIASPVDGLGDGKELQSTLQLARDPQERQKIESLLIQSQIERLEREKSQLTEALKGSEKRQLEARKLQGELSTIRQKNVRLRQRLEIGLKSPPPLPTQATLALLPEETQVSKIWQLIEPLLAQQGVKIERRPTQEIRGPKP